MPLLEKEVGVRLLGRAGRGVRLTEAGHVLARHARVLLSAAEAAEADLAALDGDVRGTVRAGGLQSAARRLLVPAVARMGAEHPRVRVEIFELELEQSLPGLRLGSVDLVIGDEYDSQPRPRPAGLRFTLLLEEPLRLVLPAAHRLARPGGHVAVNDLRSDGPPPPRAPGTTPWWSGRAAVSVATNRTCGTVPAMRTCSWSWSGPGPLSP
ncbi:LysR family transcriptional regulator [Micromonospora sp. NPDC049151]|uniref:LysR family transcriptional regulator n=1 Tax=Micromonospora sp. NPDC049151 TaxID=3155648 RepID=UPI0033DFAD3E